MQNDIEQATLTPGSDWRQPLQPGYLTGVRINGVHVTASLSYQQSIIWQEREPPWHTQAISNDNYIYPCILRIENAERISGIG